MNPPDGGFDHLLVDDVAEQIGVHPGLPAFAKDVGVASYIKTKVIIKREVDTTLFQVSEVVIENAAFTESDKIMDKDPVRRAASDSALSFPLRLVSSWLSSRYGCSHT